MMARLLEAVRPDARLILVGDPDQLASVEAGAVLVDLVAGTRRSATPESVASLRTAHRFGETIGTLAEALRAGDVGSGARAARGRWVRGARRLAGDGDAMGDVRRLLLEHALEVRGRPCPGTRARPSPGVDRHRLLCAHREGPSGVQPLEPAGRAWLGDATEATAARAGVTSGTPAGRCW